LPFRFTTGWADRVGPGLADDEVGRPEVSEGGLGTCRAAAAGDRRCESLSPEALPRRLAIPDGDDAEALVGWAGDVQEQSGWDGIEGGGVYALIVMPARSDVLNEGVRHGSTVMAAAVVSVSAHFHTGLRKETIRAMEIRVLGAVELVGTEGPVRLAAMPRRLLAALVADRGRTRSVDVLVEALWGERPPSEAGKAVQLYVSRLRKRLPEGVRIRTDSSGYAIELEDEALDAARFELLLMEARAASHEGDTSLALSRLDQALSLWRGSAFGELAYEDFARAEAERLEELRLAALEEHSEMQLRLGQHAGMVGQLRELAVAHPLRERMQAQLILALYRSGRQAEALDVYTSLRERLREELGLEPSKELRELQRRILQHDPILALEARDGERLSALPAAPNRLLGREAELIELRRLLLVERVRLLVLTGAGGSGKTRLALEAAAETADSFADGVCFVELAPLHDAKLVFGVIARALALETAPAQDPFDSVVAALRSRELLLLLDNAEHLRAAAPLFPRMLAQAPRLSLLVTSRAVLHVSGEHVYPVQPLAEPAAVALFSERARQADPRFRPSGEAARAIRQICRRLDGLPLALELAASHTRVLTPHELLDRLDPRLPLLTGGPSDLPARQQTLRATLEWSYGLLDDDEQRDLRRLAVFAGGCTLEAAEAVCDTNPERLTALVEHNLLQHHTSTANSRYTMLETIREYAAQQLEQTDEAEDSRRRHAEWCCELAESLPGSTGRLSTHPGGEEGMRLFRKEYDNVQSALAWTWAEGQDKVRLRLGGACFRMWTERALFRDAVAWLDDAAPRIPSAEAHLQLQALKVAGLIAFHILANTEEADRYWADALAVAERLGEPADVQWIESRRASAAWEQGDLERALMLWQQAVGRSRASGDRLAEAEALHLLGEALRDLGRFDEAERALFDADAICRAYRGSEIFIAANTHSLGDLALDRGDLNGALGAYRQSIDELRGRAPGQLVLCLAGIASVLVERNLDHEAAKLWGAICAAERTLGFRMLAAERRRYEKRLSRLEDIPAWRAGEAFTLEEAAAEISMSRPAASRPPAQTRP
jgi:predicted ATPase/DNA-binding SARP family transcriptional activator